MIAWAIETLFASTLLMILVLVARAPVRKLVGPQIAYALWALPVLRMLLPPMPDVMRPVITPIAAATEPGAVMMGMPVVDVPVLPQGWSFADVPPVLMVVWMAGALAFAAYHLIAYARFSARLRGGARSRSELAQGRVSMIESDAAAGPLAFGIWRKYVAFPVDFGERYDQLERDLALAHELGHHARGDLLANWIALAVLSIHWFNPVAWRAFRAFRADQEMACDALVLSGRHPALRHAYGRAIVKSAHGGAVSAACHLHTVNEIKGRLRMLSKHQKPGVMLRSFGVTGIVALTLTTLALTASGTEAAEGLKASVEDKTGVSIDAIEMPSVVAQVVPAPPEPLDPPIAPALPEASMTAELAEAEKKWAEAERERGMAEIRRRAADASRLAAEIQIPKVREENCGGEGPASYVVRGVDGHHVAAAVICTDRIKRRVETAHRQQEMAHRVAMVSKQRGLSIAIASMRSARAGVIANRYMSEADRHAALGELEEAMAEVRAQANVE